MLLAIIWKGFALQGEPQNPQPHVSRWKTSNPEGKDNICTGHTILLYSLVKHFLPLWPPAVSSPSSHFPFPRLLDQSCCPNHSGVLPIWLPQAPAPQRSRSVVMLLHALAGFLWSKFQIISAQEFTSGISPCCKACLPNTSQSCQKLVQADNKYSPLNQLQESQDTSPHLLCQMLTTHTCSNSVNTKHLTPKGPHLENKYCTAFCPSSLASAALDYWHLSTLATIFQSQVRTHFTNTFPAATLYSSVNGALLDQHLPTAVLNQHYVSHGWCHRLLVFALGSLFFLHWKNKYLISHPSQWNLNGCANTKIIHCCLFYVPITNRVLPVSFYKLICTGSVWKENKTFLYWLKKRAKLQDFQSSLVWVT